MKRLLLPLAAIVIAGLLLATGDRPAYACSVGPDWDPVAESDVIVGGRITEWQLIENVTRWDPKTETEPYDDPNYYGPYDPIRLHMTVDRVYKGFVLPKIDLYSGNTLQVRTEHGTTYYDWVGASGACGAFDFDPTGMRTILGLSRDQFGRFHPSLPRVFFIGPEAEGEYYERALSRLARLLPGYLPSSGGAPPRNEPSAVPLPTLVAAGAALLAGGSALALFARRTRP